MPEMMPSQLPLCRASWFAAESACLLPLNLRIMGNLCHRLLQQILRNAAPLECISQFARCVLIGLHLIPAQPLANVALQ
jgi:hypothetical protein